MTHRIRVAEYSHYKFSGGLGDWENGVLKIELDLWNKYHDVISKLLELGDFVWRGQRKDWPLISKFDRVVEQSDREKKLEEHKESFLHAIQGRRGINPPRLETEEEIWSLGQHYGLKTPLLDWTESPFVAAYFAFLKKDIQVELGPTETYRFIYALSKDIRRWGPAKSKEEGPFEYYIKFLEPLSDENPRLLNQKSLFTISMSGEINIEETVQKCYSKDIDKGKSRIILVKIKIPNSEREKCLLDLNRMNINHATLFPDLIGAADFCNLQLEIENYY